MKVLPVFFIIMSLAYLSQGAPGGSGCDDDIQVIQTAKGKNPTNNAGIDCDGDNGGKGPKPKPKPSIPDCDDDLPKYGGKGPRPKPSVPDCDDKLPKPGKFPVPVGPLKKKYDPGC